MTTTIMIWTLASVLILVGLAGTVLPALPGPILLFGGLFTAAWAEEFAYVGTGTLTVIGVLALLAYLVDFVAGAFFGLIGVLLGPFIGAVLGELSNQRGLEAASRAGLGATIGLVVGTAAKLALGFAMIGLFVFVRFV